MEWSAILALIELLFILPVSNAKVEAFFSLMKHVKTDARASLKEHHLNSLLRIITKGHQQTSSSQPQPSTFG